MKRIFICLAVMLGAVSCQKYDDTQIRKDISELQEQVSSLKAWCDNSRTAIDAVAELKKAVENFNGISYVETFFGDFGTGYNIVLDNDEVITIYNVKVSGESSYLGNVEISESSVKFILTDGTSFILPRQDATISFGSFDKRTVAAGDTVNLILNPSFTKASYAGIKAELASESGVAVSVATKGAVEAGWKIKVLNPKFGEDGKVAENPAVLILDTPGDSTDAILTVTVVDNAGGGHTTATTLTAGILHADIVVYGKIFTSEVVVIEAPVEAEEYQMAKAMAVKDGKYLYVGSREGVQKFIGKETKVIDWSGKGMVMPTCANGHAHYLLGFGLKRIGMMIDHEADVKTFLDKVAVEAADAKAKGKAAIIGFGWNYHIFKDKMPTRQDLDRICSDIPMYFADEEGHKGLANTLCLQMAGVLDNDGKPLMAKDAIRGGEIEMNADGVPTGFLKEQAGTYVRSKMDNDKLYPVEVAEQSLKDMEKYLHSVGYTMVMDGWSNYFYNESAYKAASQLDDGNDFRVLLGMSYEFESWSDRSKAMEAANQARQYASRHVNPGWVKLFVDGTVEGGSGYCITPYPDGHQGLINWNEEELAEITREANGKGLSMHVHTMGDGAVRDAVDAFAEGGQKDRRNTLVHVRNVPEGYYQKMADNNVYVTSGMLWHHFPELAPFILYLTGMVPEGMEEQSYPMKSYFDYGVNVSSHTDFPALSSSPDSPFGIMEIAVNGIWDKEQEGKWGLGGWWIEELLTRQQALQALTINGARQLFLEEERGSIREGKYADFLLIDQDVLTCEVSKIRDTKVVNTYFEGKRVYPAE